MDSLLQYLVITSCILLLSLSARAQSSYPQKATEVDPVMTGTTMPNATVKTVEGKQVELQNLVKQKPTVLIFYRGGWCPYCNAHLAELQNIEQQLVDMGYQILAVSPDRPALLKKSISKHNLDYTLLSDSPMNLSKAFGLAYKLDDKTVAKYKKMGTDLEKDSGYNHHLLPVPAVYLINPDGLITFQYVNPNYKTRINSEVLLTAAKVYLPEG